MADEQEAPVETFNCFLSQLRTCDIDCVAHLTALPEGEDYAGQPFSKCMLLVNAHRTGKHLVVLASVSKSAADISRKHKEDATRKGSLKPGGLGF